MYYLQWKRPGVVALPIMVFVALMAAVVLASFIAVLGGRSMPSWWVLTLLFLVAMWVQIRVFRRVTTRRIPICPHCGVRTDARFRICRSCGRVKDQPVSP